MSTPETKSVTVGDTSYNIARFKGFKALNIGRIVKDITRQVPEIAEAMAAFTRKYEHDNAVRITREMSVLPRFKPMFDGLAFTDEDWQRCGGAVEIPQPPDTGTVIAAVFPLVFDQAEEHLLNLIAWCAAPNSELREADEGEGVDQYIANLRKKLLHEGDLDELIDLTIASTEVVMDQFTGKMGKLQLLISAFTGRLENLQRSTTPGDQDDSVDDDSEPTSTTKPNLSTDSEAPTDGPVATPSTPSSGVS